MMQDSEHKFSPEPESVTANVANDQKDHDSNPADDTREAVIKRIDIYLQRMKIEEQAIIEMEKRLWDYFRSQPTVGQIFDEVTDETEEDTMEKGDIQELIKSFFSRIEGKKIIDFFTGQEIKIIPVDNGDAVEIAVDNRPPKVREFAKLQGSIPRYALVFDEESSQLEELRSVVLKKREILDFIFSLKPELEKIIHRDFINQLNENSISYYIGFLRFALELDSMAVGRGVERLSGITIEPAEPLFEEIGHYKDGEIKIKKGLKSSESVTAALHHETGHFIDDLLITPQERIRYQALEREFANLVALVNHTGEHFFSGPFGEWTEKRTTSFTRNFAEFFAETYKDMAMGEEIELLKHIESLQDMDVKRAYLNIVKGIFELVK